MLVVRRLWWATRDVFSFLSKVLLHLFQRVVCSLRFTPEKIFAPHDLSNRNRRLQAKRFFFLLPTDRTLLSNQLTHHGQGGGRNQSFYPHGGLAPPASPLRKDPLRLRSPLLANNAGFPYSRLQRQLVAHALATWLSSPSCLDVPARCFPTPPFAAECFFRRLDPPPSCYGGVLPRQTPSSLFEQTPPFGACVPGSQGAGELARLCPSSTRDCTQQPQPVISSRPVICLRFPHGGSPPHGADGFPVAAALEVSRASRRLCIPPFSFPSLL